MSSAPPPSSAAALSPEALARAPSLRRRLACFLYEGVLLFGVVMIAGYLFSSLTQQRHALHGRHELQAFMFVVLGIYFVWFWSRSGQTLAMKTWHIRLVTVEGLPVSQARALLRFLLSWVWFLPSLALIQGLGWCGTGPIFGALIAWVVAYALLSYLRHDHQYWHDVICGTRIVSWQPALQSKSAA